MSIRLRISPDTGDEVQPLPRVVLLGDDHTAEFCLVTDDLTSVVPASVVTRIRGLAELDELHRQGEFADLVIIVQTWSDEFRFRDFLLLTGIGPFTRVICCHGPWCVSDGRSRQDWPLAVRVPLEHFRTALLHEWQQLTNPQSRQDNLLPWTAGRDEIFRTQRKPVTTSGKLARGVPIRVVSSDRPLAELWRDLFRQAGWTIAETPADGQLVLWDVDPWCEENVAAWAQEHEKFPATRFVALTGFAGPDAVRQIRDRGADTVISKLLPLDQLLIEICPIWP